MSDNETADEGTNVTLDTFYEGGPDTYYAMILTGAYENARSTLATLLKEIFQIHQEEGYGNGVVKVSDPETAAEALLRPALSDDNNWPNSFDGGQLWYAPEHERKQFEDIIQGVSQEEVDLVVINQLSVLGTDVHEIKNRIVQILEVGSKLHITATGTRVSPDNSSTVIGLLDSLDRAGVELTRRSVRRDLIQEVSKEVVDKPGRPGLGFEMKDGERVPGPDYDVVCEVLELANLDEDDPNSMSIRRAAKKLDCSRKTIYRALQDHPDRYGLDS